MTPEDLQEQIDELSMRLEASESLSKELKDEIGTMTSNQFSMTRTMSPEDKTELGILMEEQIANIIWGSHFHYFTFFESLDGWGTAGATVGIINRLYIDPSGTTTGYAKKKVILQNALTYLEESSFRSSFQISSALDDGLDISSTTAYFGTGHSITGGSNNLLDDGLAAGEHYGFYLDNDKLYGITSDGEKYTSIELVSGIKFGDTVGVEAKFYPGSRVDFYTSNAEDGIEVGALELRGSLSDTLPSGTRNAIGEFSINDTIGSTGQAMNIGFCEILQKRKQ